MAILLSVLSLLAYTVAMTMTIMIIRLDQANIIHKRNPLMRMMFVRLGLIPTAFIGTSLYLVIVVLAYYLYTLMDEILLLELLALMSIYVAINDTRWYLRLRKTNTKKACNFPFRPFW
jgi:hypothetical protein